MGDLYYFDSVRVNLGLFQHDVNVIWDLAPHDVSIMDYLLSQKPKAISATGVAHFDSKIENIAYISTYYDNNLMGHIHVNWLAPVKVRKTLLSGFGNDIVNYKDTGGLWRMGHEYWGGAFKRLEKSSWLPADIRAVEKNGFLEAVVESELSGMRLVRHLWFRDDSPVVRMRLSG